MRSSNPRPPDNLFRTVLIVALATVSITVAAGVFWNRIADTQGPGPDPVRFMQGQPVLQLIAVAALAIGALIAAMFQFGRGGPTPRWFTAVVAVSAVLVALCLGLGVAYFMLTHPG